MRAESSPLCITTEDDSMMDETLVALLQRVRSQLDTSCQNSEDSSNSGSEPILLKRSDESDLTVTPVAAQSQSPRDLFEESFEATKDPPCAHNVWVRVRRLRRQPGVHLRCHVCDALWETLIEYHEKCSGFYSGTCDGSACNRPHVYARGILPTVEVTENGVVITNQTPSLRSLKNGRTRTRRSKKNRRSRGSQHSQEGEEGGAVEGELAI